MASGARNLAAGIALLALSQPLAAQSAPCTEPADLSDTVTYAMPLLMQGLQTKCADSLPADSFVRARGPAFAQSFEPLRDSAWPGARRTLMRFIENRTDGAGDGEAAASSQNEGIVRMIASLEGDELRPFVDALAVQMIAEEVKPVTCEHVEAVLPLLAPLPPENYGALIATVFGIMSEDDASLPFCPAEPR